MSAPRPELRAGELQTVRGTVVDLDGRTTGNGRSLVAVLLESDGLYVRGRLVQSALDDP